MQHFLLVLPGTLKETRWPRLPGNWHLIYLISFNYAVLYWEMLIPQT